MARRRRRPSVRKPRAVCTNCGTVWWAKGTAADSSVSDLIRWGKWENCSERTCSAPLWVAMPEDIEPLRKIEDGDHRSRVASLMLAGGAE